MRLPADVFSPDQISELTMELRRYIDAQTDASRRSDHASAPDIEVSSLLQDTFESSGSPSAVQLLEELEGLLKSAPVVHVITAARPGNDLKRQISGWFRGEIHEQTLLVFVERHDLGGGVVIRAGS